jgi:hypothetical protein
MSKDNVKFKAHHSKFLSTLVVRDKEKADSKAVPTPRFAVKELK